MSDTGTLYIVATPIGNLEDVTRRAERVLKEVSLVLCEDTRRTARLMNHLGISNRRASYHDHNEEQRLPDMLQRLQNGQSLALVSDAGTPGISDPGYRLVRAARAAGVPVVPVPGPSAAITAVSVSGLPTDSFRFVGFLPAKKKARRALLDSLAGDAATLVFYEAPHRIRATLSDLAAALGTDREAFLARELTKMHEELLTGTLAEIEASVTQRETIKGEITLVVSGASRKNGPAADVVSNEALVQAVEKQIRKGLKPMDAIKKVAKRHGLPKARVYDLMQS